MANRIRTKKSLDKHGNEKDAYEWIKDYLRLKGEKRFSEIRQFLKEHGIRYASDKGLDLALKSLMEQNVIGKRKVSTNPFLRPHPVYYLKMKKLDVVTAIAQQFDDEVLRGSAYLIKLSKQNKESDEEYLIRNLIHAYGFYVLYVLIKGWKYTSDKNTHSLNSEIFSTWLKYTQTSGLHGFLLEEGITELVGARGYEAVSTEDSYKLYTNRKKWIKLLELENLLQRMYPAHFEYFDELLNKPLEKPVTLKEIIKISKANAKKHPVNPEEIEKWVKEMGGKIV